MKSKWTQQRLQ